MASKAQEKKITRYLEEGRLKVQAHSLSPPTALITAEGSADQPYSIRFESNTWTCTCEARVALCVHVLAAMRISPLRTTSDGDNALPHTEALDEELATRSTGVLPVVVLNDMDADYAVFVPNSPSDGFGDDTWWHG